MRITTARIATTTFVLALAALAGCRSTPERLTEETALPEIRYFMIADT